MDIDSSWYPLNALTTHVSRRAALGHLAGAGVAAALLAAARHANGEAQATPEPEPEEGATPNHFVLSNGETQIVYDTTAFAGEPQLTFRGPISGGSREEGPIENRTVVGDEIGTQPTAIGQLITVYLDAHPDAATFYLTLLLPAFNPLVPGEAIPFATLAILTAQLTSIAGPALIKGALQEYEVVELEGTAEFVLS